MNQALKIKKNLFLTCLALCFLILPSQAHAASVDIGISPPILQIEAIPPVDIKTPITLENFGDEEVILSIQLRPFKAASSANGQLEYISDSEFHPADPQIFQKIQILENDHVRKNIVLAPRQQKTLAIHIGIPKGEPLTDYYFSIIFISNTANASGQSQSQTPGGIATNVLLSVGKKEQAEGYIEQFSAPFMLESGPVPFTLRIRNTGNRVINPEGQILIKNMFGQTIGKVDLLPVNILADSSREVPDSLLVSNKQSKELLQLRSQSQSAWWPEEFILGPYTASLTVALSDHGPLYRKTVVFLGIPLQAVATLIITIIVVIFIVRRVRRKTT